MERHFDDELKILKEKLLHMASRVEEAIHLSIKGLVERNEAIAKKVIASDQEINLAEIDIDEFSVKLLALYHPEAGDLRTITMVMRINNDLERMGDLAVNIAERVLDLLKEPLLKPLIDIPRMSVCAQKMVQDALDAFVNQNADLAREVCIRDSEVDGINDQLFRELLTYMIQDPRSISRAVHLILIGRHIERIADHATNIGEDVFFMVKGKTIKHHVAD